MSVQTVQSMAKWVEENIVEHPTLGEMSAHVGYSPWYCSTRFREVMGVTFKQYLARCRLRAAARDLGWTQDRITDIAYRYGYSSPEALTRAFTTEYGCSPRQYRRCADTDPEV